MRRRIVTDLSLLLIITSAVILSTANKDQDDFKTAQLRYERVRSAVGEKEGALKSLFAEKGLAYPPREIFIRAFKQEKSLELWARASTEEDFLLMRAYDICSLSGGLGPKRREGDLQVPEGFYAVDRFNPASAFYLSLGIDYPNDSDTRLGDPDAPGGEIFIHGSCVTIGCLPLTDDMIKEVYLAAVEAREAGQKRIPVHIFPCRLTDDGLSRLGTILDGAPPPDSLPIKDAFGQEDLLAFWRNLKEGYDLFEQTKRVPVVSVDGKTGRYIF